MNTSTGSREFLEAKALSLSMKHIQGPGHPPPPLPWCKCGGVAHLQTEGVAGCRVWQVAGCGACRVWQVAGCGVCRVWQVAGHGR
jgi:hypothetical protein